MEHLSLPTLLKRHVRSARQKARRAAARGFTLIEMLVVIFIITVLMAVILVGESSFNNSLFLSNTAYTIATSIRGAESLGISSKGFSGNSNAGYGIHFDSSSQTTFTEFADILNTKLTQTQAWCPVGTTGAPDAKPGDCIYNGSGEKIVQYNLNQGMKISDFCAYRGGVLLGCATSNGSTLKGLDIVFVRPNMDAVITISNAIPTYLQATLACMKLTSPSNNNAFRYIEVNELGEIAVTTSCP